MSQDFVLLKFQYQAFFYKYSVTLKLKLKKVFSHFSVERHFLRFFFFNSLTHFKLKILVYLSRSQLTDHNYEKYILFRNFELELEFQALLPILT